jgi:hypothetical protein
MLVFTGVMILRSNMPDEVSPMLIKTTLLPRLYLLLDERPIKNIGPNTEIRRIVLHRRASRSILDILSRRILHRK